MVEIKRVDEDYIKEIVAKHGFNLKLILKDYYLTIILYLLRDIKGIHFKGGTALHKIFLNYARLSEDADYTVTEDMELVKKQITEIITSSNIFEKISKDKDVDGFTRLLVHYKEFNNVEEVIFIDLNKRANLKQNSEMHKINHFYSGFIPEFSCNYVSREEMIAEKMAATIGRNKPRDHFDLYKIIENKIPINIELVKIKCKESGDEFSILKMFNNAQKLHKRWNEDMMPLLSEEIEFKQVMQTLAKHFNLKIEKENQKEEQTNN